MDKIKTRTKVESRSKRNDTATIMPNRVLYGFLAWLGTTTLVGWLGQSNFPSYAMAWLNSHFQTNLLKLTSM